MPLYELVYDDVIVTIGTNDLRSWLHANAAPMNAPDGRRRMALHERVGLLEMVNQEFRNAKRTRERTAFADGSTVTIDWETKSVTINPELKAEAAADR